MSKRKHHDRDYECCYPVAPMGYGGMAGGYGGPMGGQGRGMGGGYGMGLGYGMGDMYGGGQGNCFTPLAGCSHGVCFENGELLIALVLLLIFLFGRDKFPC